MRFLILAACLLTGCDTYKVVGVTDGDTITVLHRSEQIKVRLYGIDAPESKQPFGAHAKVVLSSKVFGKNIKFEPKGKDRYGRAVANIYVGSRWINKEMVDEGMAWHYQRFSPGAVELAKSQAEAKNKQKGLWLEKNPVPPWEYRRKR